MSDPRREDESDLAVGVGAAVRGLELPWLAVLADCARADALVGRPLVNFRDAEARALWAIAALLAPGTGTPGGAAVAAAVHFVDRALDMRFFAEALPVMRAGLADLEARARGLGATSFAVLDVARQAGLVRQLERTPFIATARELLATGADAARESHRSVA
jgi:hypothetical protein